MVNALISVLRGDRDTEHCKGLFGYNGSVPSPHTNDLFPFRFETERMMFSQQKRSSNGTVPFLPNGP